MDMNTISLVGRLAAKPSLKLYIKKDGTEGARTFFRLAVTRLSDRGEKDRSKRRANFIPVVCWGGLAKRVAQYLDKGVEVSVIGELIAESKVIEGSNPVVYNEYTNVQATDVQFGRRPNKATSDTAGIAAEIAELKSRLDSDHAPAAATASNPFRA